MRISEIFCSINGESTRSGKRTVFIRTFGCNLRCNWCDSMYSVEGDNHVEMSIDEIVDKVESFNCTRVTITGGEPMIQPQIINLIKRLYEDENKLYDIEIETNGACDLSELIELRSKEMDESLIITMDWKCPSSGMNESMLQSNLKLLEKTDVVKCVVGDIEDLEEAKVIANRTKAQVYLSPVFGMIEPKQIAEYIIDGELNDVTLQLQQHKFIWPADMRGV